MLGLELAHLERRGLVSYFMAQHPEGAVRAQVFIARLRVCFGKLGSKLVDEGLLGIAGVKLLIFFSGLWLGCFDVCQAIFGVECQFPIVFGRIAKFPTASDHLGDDVRLKGRFLGVSVHLVANGLVFKLCLDSIDFEWLIVDTRDEPCRARRLKFHSGHIARSSEHGVFLRAFWIMPPKQRAGGR